MRKPTRFQPYDREQLLLLPQDMREWLPEGDLAYFIPDVVETLDLGAIYGDYDGSRGGQPPCHPDELSADNGYFSEDNVTNVEKEEIEPYIATGRQKHGEKTLPACGRIRKDATVRERMARKLRTLRGRGAYKKRKQTVEPVFGQIKGARGFRQFLLRGLRNVSAEWDLICLTHNLLKLHRSGWKVQTA